MTIMLDEDSRNDADRRDRSRLDDILSADEAHPSLARQLAGSAAGLLLMLLTGIVILLLVLWRSP